MIKKLACTLQRWINATRIADFLGPLALRLYLVPIFWMAGTNKLLHIDSTIQWFANPDWGLGLPFPALLAWVASLTEVIGAVLLFIGLGVRWIAIPLMVVMLVAVFSVHWEHGWLAIAPNDSSAGQRLTEFLQWLQSNHPERHAHITQLGSPVILNNGIEFAVTYFIMLLNLFFFGAGKYLSVDYWLYWICKRPRKANT